jgi:hypothetical protein
MIGAPSATLRRSAALGLLLVCALAPQLPCLGYGFVDYDDPPSIIHLPLIRQLGFRTLPRFFRLQVFPGLPEYMPFKNLSYALDYSLFELWAPGYRAQQLFWYAAATLLLYRYLRTLLEALAREQRLRLPATWAAPLAWSASALFALHPAHVESVTWLSGRKDLLSGTFMLLALCCALSFRPRSGQRSLAYAVGTLVATAVALLSKPMAAVLPALMLLADLLCAPRELALRTHLRPRLWLYAGVSTLVVTFAVTYYQLVRDYTDIDASAAAELYGGPSWLRWGQQLSQFLGLAVAPERLTPCMPPQLLDEHWFSLPALLGIAVLIAAVGCGVWLVKRRHPLAFALGWFVLPLSPILIAPPWAQYVAGRYLFLSIGGLAFGLAWLGAWVLARRPSLHWAVWSAYALVAARLLIGTLDYSRDWRDSVTLWTSAIELYPTVPLYYERAGAAALKTGNTELAAGIFDACLRLRPERTACSVGLASSLSTVRPAYARELLERALPHDELGIVHIALALQTAVHGEPQAALRAYEAWLEGRPVRNPNELSAYVQLALLAEKPAKAWHGALQGAHFIAARFPAGPPPAKLLVDAAEARGNSTFTAQVRAILERCPRADCAAAALARL